MPTTRRPLLTRLCFGLLCQTILFALFRSYLLPDGFDEDAGLAVIALVTAVPVLLAVGWPFLREELRWRGRDLSVLCAVGLVFAALAVSIVGGILAGLVGKLCGALGWSTSTGVGVATSHVTLWGVLYACLVGPVIEELVWRGAALGVLARYGRGLAIVLSAFGFGLTHHDLEQGISAFCTGLLLGYIAWTWGLRYAIGAHILSNSWDTLASSLTSTNAGSEAHLGNLVVALVTVAAIIIGIILLIAELKARRTPDARASRPVTEPGEEEREVASAHPWWRDAVLWAYVLAEVVLTAKAMAGI